LHLHGPGLAAFESKFCPNGDGVFEKKIMEFLAKGATAAGQTTGKCSRYIVLLVCGGAASVYVVLLYVSGLPLPV
jgi:hypothetical protein